MNMQALNQLVARSITDPAIVQGYTNGSVDEVIAEFDFSPELRIRLKELEAGSWAEFAMLAYRVVKASDEPVRRIELPSPLEGLVDSEDAKGREQVA
jgi:hypothetical protein